MVGRRARCRRPARDTSSLRRHGAKRSRPVTALARARNEELAPPAPARYTLGMSTLIPCTVFSIPSTVRGGLGFERRYAAWQAARAALETRYCAAVESYVLHRVSYASPRLTASAGLAIGDVRCRGYNHQNALARTCNSPCA